MLELATSSKIVLYAAIWGGLLLLLLFRTSYSRLGSVGLPFAFIMNYTVVHGGAVLYLTNDYDPFVSAYLTQLGFTRETVALGLEASCLAMASAYVGNLIADIGLSMAGRPVVSERVSLSSLRIGARDLLIISLTALIATVALYRVGITFSGIQAVVKTLQYFMLPGAACLILYLYLLRNGRRPLLVGAALMMITPAILLVTTAIFADSVAVAVIIASYLFSVRDQRGWTLGRNLTILAVFLVSGVVFSIFYMQSRGSVRETVKHGASIGSTIDVLATSASIFQVDTVLATDALVLLDARLDENIFVGLAVEYLKEHPKLHANGDTIGAALLGWIPRALWPGKPEEGGSEFMSKYTGRAFSQTTTMGSGPILEFFVDFGYTGIAFGFIFLGVLLRLIDVVAYRSLHGGDIARFAQYMSTGAVIVAPLTSLIALVTGVATAFLVGWLLRNVWKPQIADLNIGYASTASKASTAHP